MKVPTKRRIKPKQHISRMERARDLLQQIVMDRRRSTVGITPEDVALVTTMLQTVAMLEHEIGRWEAEALAGEE
jgi:hypothetical protein